MLFGYHLGRILVLGFLFSSSLQSSSRGFRWRRVGAALRSLRSLQDCGNREEETRQMDEMTGGNMKVVRRYDEK
ncbi:uncharacterized protein GGS25DRAFT_473629 [Hypoxylon fragiforme]|uniref:uncharacterized protein n=1 Tax=Hypoxylon fragiforme TaxID=63214 RepID=UPI0020C6D1E2|nr:uncharacterized protein GGS25DRAFT_473629 [Hypoxylon fragiforme]KAI2612057.1 hypothetical protein GGS25DRAFT_473629 [Hypoxylon fragiforme]